MWTGGLVQSAEIQVPDCSKEGAELEDKTFELPVGLHSNSHQWSQARKNEITDTSG